MINAGTHTFLQNTRSRIPGILLVLCLLAACKNDPKEIDMLVNKSTMQVDKAYDVTILYSENGQTKFRIFAKEFIRNENAKPPYTDMKNGMRIEVFDDSLNVETVLSARYARLYEKQNNVLIRDSIVVVNKRNERLETEELVWNQTAKKFFTEKFVKITTPTQTIYGDGLEANEDFSWYRIKNPKGAVQINKAQMPGE